MAALASRMLWPASLSARTVTNGGRTYNYAKVVDVLAADVSAATSAGLVLIAQCGATPSGVSAVGIAGTLGAPPNSPPGGIAGMFNTAYPDPNRPTPGSVSAGTPYLDAALQRIVYSDGVNWIDPISGNVV